MDNMQNSPQMQQMPPQSVGCPQPSTIFNAEYQQQYGIADLPTAQPIQKRRYTIIEGVTAVICLVLGFLFMHYCFAYVGGIFGGVFWAVFGVLGAVFAKVKKLPVTKGHVVVFAAAELFCFVPLFSANLVINTLAAFFVFGLYCYLGFTLSGARLFGERFVSDLLCSVFVRPFASYGDCPKAAVGLFGHMKSGRSVLYVFVGLLIALPLTLVVGALLISSDQMFADFMEGIFEGLPAFSFSIVGEMFWGIFVALFLCGILFSAEKRVDRSEKAQTFRFIPLAAAITAVTPICLFYLVYLIIQTRYLFAAFGGALPEDVSYSDFARDGFFELCVVASINLVVILLMQAFTARRENDRRPKALTVYTVMISVFTLLLIATAVCKMFIYIGEYGMTPLRVYTTWFMALLAVFFIIVILWQFVKLPLWRTVFAAFTVMFALLCFGNTDSFIARYNVDAYVSGSLSELDYSLLETLGTAAIPAVSELADKEEAALDMMARCHITLVSNRVNSFEEYAGYFSIPRAMAVDTIEENKELVATSDEYVIH